MKHRLGSHRQSGFTLVELLVSLALFGLAASLLLAGLNMTWVSARSQHMGDNAGQDVVAAQSILRQRIERMFGLVRLDSSVALVDANGNERTFSFFAAPLPRTAPDAVQRYRLILTSAGDLMLYTANGLDDRIDLGDRSLAYWAPSRLLTGVRELSLNYFGSTARGTGTGWQNSWSDRPEPPALVRVRVSFAPSDKRIWPDLIVRPRANVNTVCRIDRATQRCAATS
jgi:general secretion pathway protein J